MTSGLLPSNWLISLLKSTCHDRAIAAIIIAGLGLLGVTISALTFVQGAIGILVLVYVFIEAIRK